jgi:hypothetical protein
MEHTNAPCRQKTQSVPHRKHITSPLKHNRSEMVAVLGPFEALPYYIHTYIHTLLLHYKAHPVNAV